MRPWFIAKASLSWLFLMQSTSTTHITVNKAAKQVISTVVKDGTPDTEVGHGVADSDVVLVDAPVSSSAKKTSHDENTARRRASILIVLLQKTDVKPENYEFVNY